MPTSKRLASIPPFVFTALDAQRKALEAEGHDVINLSVGDPDMGAPKFVVDALTRAATDPANHHYNYGRGRPELLQAAAEFMKRRFNVDADPDKHIQILIGSKEGLAHLPLAVADPGDRMHFPDPCYPVYRNAALYTGLTPAPVALSEDNAWMMDFDAIDPAGAAMLLVNHPGNPTAATAPVDFFDRAARFATQHDITLVSDQAYSEIYFDDDHKPPSLWQAESADIDSTPAVEFHSLSKTFCMTGWRIAFAVGNPDVVSALARVKATHDSGPFAPIQLAGAEALKRYDDPAVAAYRDTYRARRDVLIPALNDLGLETPAPKAGFFAWGKVPAGTTSAEFAKRCLDEARVVIVPGSAFGAPGEGYFRVALTVDESRLREAVERLTKVVANVSA